MDNIYKKMVDDVFKIVYGISTTQWQSISLDDDEDTDPGIKKPGCTKCKVVPQLPCDSCGACGKNDCDKNACDINREWKSCQQQPLEEEPKNNQGRTTCFRCGGKLSKVPAFFGHYDVCKKCKI